MPQEALFVFVPQVGLAEAAVAMAKLASRQGDSAAAASHLAAALGHYSKHRAITHRACDG
jgi:hypothetical protein